MNLPRALLLLSVLVPGLLAAPPAATAAQPQAAPLHPQATVYFEPNLGQAGSDVHFRVVGGVPAEIGPAGVSFGIASDGGQDVRGEPLRRRDVEAQGEGARAPRPAALQMSFPGSFLGDVVTGERLRSFSNYFVGSDPSRWLRRIPHYASVRYRGVQPGIDLEFHRRNGTLEYDFVVAPGARAEALLVRFSGHQSLSLAADGSLVVATSQGVLRQRAPRAFQRLRGRTADVQVGFVLADRDTVAFRLGSFDRHQELVIDPAIEWTKTVPFAAGHMVLDSNLNVYLAGWESQCQNCYWPDARLRKLDPTGELLWDTTVGGAYWDSAIGLALGPDGSLFVTGRTSSPDFPPPSPGAWYAGAPPGTVQRGSFIYKAFLMKLDPNNGSLNHATYFGGASGFGGEQRSLDWGNAVAVDGSGHVYVTGGSTSQDFPVTANAPVSSPGASGDWGISVGFLVKLDPSLSTLELGTYLSSSTDVYEDAAGYDVTADAAGNVVAVGYTASDSFLITPGAFDPTNQLFDYSGFATRFDSLGNLVYSTYVGGTFSDEVWAVTTDPLGRACMTGRTWSDDFPVEPPGTSTRHGAEDAFLTCLLPSGELAASVYYGGPNIDTGHDIGADDLGTLYVMGITYQGPSGPTDQFVAAFTADGRLDWPFRLGQPSTWDNVSRAAVPKTGGAVYTFGVLGGTAVTRIDICGQGLRSVCVPPHITITTDTTRWRPQRSPETVIVQVGSPVELDTSLPFTLVYSGPIPSAPTALQLTAQPSGPPQGHAFGYTLAWNHVDPTTQLLLPAGNYSLVVTAQPRSQQSPPPAPLTSPPYDKVSLVEVRHVEFFQCSDPTCGPLDVNPNLGAGSAFFPDAESPGGASYRALVGVRALMEPPLLGAASDIHVYFRALDVDDPSAALAPIDADTPRPTPDNPAADNSGECPLLLSSPCTAPAVAAQLVGATDTSETSFAVSPYPGANYRIAASTHAPWLMDLRGVLSSMNGAVEHSNGGALSSIPSNNEVAQVSEMLTVWRVLNIEQKKMDPAAAGVTQQQLQHLGVWSDIKNGKVVHKPQGIKDADHPDKDDWVGAYLRPAVTDPNAIDVEPGVPDGQTVYFVNGSKKDSASVEGSLAPFLASTNQTYYLRDDELANFTGRQHDLSFLTPLLAQAYIRVGTEHNPAPLVPWATRLTPQGLNGVPRLPNSAPGWSVPSLLAFEVLIAGNSVYRNEHDNNPGTLKTSGTLGLTCGGGPLCGLPGDQPAAATFVETIRDYAWTDRSSIRATVPADDIYGTDVAHEILHTLGLWHNGGIMCSTRKNYAGDPMRYKITDQQIATLRKLTQPHVVDDRWDSCSTVPEPNCCPDPQ